MIFIPQVVYIDPETPLTYASKHNVMHSTNLMEFHQTNSKLIVFESRCYHCHRMQHRYKENKALKKCRKLYKQKVRSIIEQKEGH
jgi:flagellar biosynthesis regulator FlbT